MLSKNVFNGAKVVEYFRRRKEFGIAHECFTIDISGVRDSRSTHRSAAGATTYTYSSGVVPVFLTLCFVSGGM